MKALMIAREGRKAILLLPGGEMRTVRARRNWQVGQEVQVRARAAVSFRRTGRPVNWRAAVGPLAVCAAAVALLFAGVQRLGGEHVDQVHSVQPMAPGSTAEHTQEPTAEPTALPVAEVHSTPTPASAFSPTPLPPETALPEPTAEPESTHTDAAPTPKREEQRCEECGATGHDDDDCPNQICEECGEAGHDDDDCHQERHHGD